MNASADVARLQHGLPFPVKCCWNGVAVLDAAPFLRGLRIRSKVHLLAAWHALAPHPEWPPIMQYHVLHLDFPPNYAGAGRTRLASALHRSARCCAMTSCASAAPGTFSLFPKAKGLMIHPSDPEHQAIHRRNVERCVRPQMQIEAFTALRLCHPAGFVLDPSVRQAYTLREARDLYSASRLPGVGTATWQEVAAAPPIDWSKVCCMVSSSAQA